MRRFRRTNSPLPGRKPKPWTPLEVSLIALSLLLIVFPLYGEVYRWVNPSIVPAAPLGQRVTAVPSEVTQPPATQPPGATNTPDPGLPTNTPDPGLPTNTPDPGLPTNTPDPGLPTNTPDPGATQPPATQPPGEPTATSTPFVGEPPLTVEKIASVSSAGRGQEFNYVISVFSNSETPRNVQVQDDIAAELEVLSASPSNGTCTVGDPVSCQVSVQRGQPASVNIGVRVRDTAAPGTSVSNRGLAQDDANNTAASDAVSVEITDQVAPPPNPTTPPGQPTTPPGQPTTPPGQPTTPPGQPTTPPAPDPPPPRDDDDDDDDDGGSEPAPPPAPTSPPPPPLPPVPPPQPAPPAPAPQPPIATVPVATAISPGADATATQAAEATATAQIPTATPTPDPDIFFRMASDWGSAFPDQEVNYVIALRNVQPSDGRVLSDVNVSSTLPSNLEVIAAQSDVGVDPNVAGNTVSLALDELRPGEGIEIAVQTRIDADVEIGTRLVAQAELNHEGLELPAFSNVVTVLVVGVAPLNAQTNITSTATLTTTTATAATVGTETPTLTVELTETPTATGDVTTEDTDTTAEPEPTDVPAPAGGATEDSDTLPATSTGIPFLGFTLLGATLMVRTVRIRRDQSRI
ncbi:MAG: hypothetical protein GFH27_549323n51 [Chloroflexi bacterium AL-W]|nr:hypothetical protein [Chloroflexi bacterium AL-N1]NOK70202.1 hypothetical protein [Chloroflexi bacterium AL-N10]NOK77739.1 hypothetical protein [Chloroflexi bacterium AL-N5]NOK84748.1 hypothetical protein [Chloroflexi bacterium AL-W]NOK93189.1 hypothetical protein [Chloroflexi bacterium AL-N15]